MISCIFCRYYKCNYCNEIITTSNYDYCNSICEFNDIFKDSFRILGSTECKYLYDIANINKN
jgi:hypothetical protein